MRRSGRIDRVSATRAWMVAAERGSRLPCARVIRAGAAMAIGSLRTGASDSVVPDGWWLGSVGGHWWMPHSVFWDPAQRPLRGSSPSATRWVHGQQPIEG